MKSGHQKKVALIYPGDLETRQNATPENNRLASIFRELHALGLRAEPAVYHDDFQHEVLRQLMQADGVLVWMNPIQDGRDRTVLDGLLREVSQAGIFVSAHPDIILKMGTKEVLHTTRNLGWGSDVRLYAGPDRLRDGLAQSLAGGQARVLKQYRGNGGNGVWKVQLAGGAERPGADELVRVRHAKRGCVEETMTLDGFLTRCEPYFRGQGKIIDQAYQERLPEGMIRCYLVHDKVAGFGHQAINALYPAPPGLSASHAPEPGPRLYHPPDLPQFQALKQKVEDEWVPGLQGLLKIKTAELPVLWDCDFLLGPKTPSGQDSYVLCEINVSSIAPYPESAAPLVARATLERLQALS